MDALGKKREGKKIDTNGLNHKIFFARMRFLLATKRKLAARQCLSKSDYRGDYLLLALPPQPNTHPKGLFAASLVNGASPGNHLFCEILAPFTDCFHVKTQVFLSLLLKPSHKWDLMYQISTSEKV